MAPGADPTMPDSELMLLPTSSGGSQFGWHFLTSWSNCQTYWWNRTLRPHPAGGVGIEAAESRVPLALGSAFHKFLEVWYGSGWEVQVGRLARDSGRRELSPALAVARAELAERGFDPSTGEEAAVAAWATLEELALKYHGIYGPDGAQQEWPAYRVRSDADGEPYVERELAVQLGYRDYTLTARLDLIVESDHGLVALEHKTSAAGLAHRLLDRFELDGQATVQALMLALHFPGEPIVGVELNVAIKDRAARSPLPALMRRMTHRSEVQLEKLRMDAVRKLRSIDDAVGYYRMLLGQGMTADEAARVAFDGSPDGYQCVGAFGKCAFFDLCANRQISDQIVARDFRPRTYAYHWENPYLKETTGG